MGWEKYAALIGGYALAIPTGGASIPVGTAIYTALDQKEKIKKAQEQLNTASGDAKGALDASNTQVRSDLAASQQGVQAAQQQALGATQQAQQAIYPYQQLGGQGANALSNLMGFGGIAQPPPAYANPSAPAAAASPMMGAPGPMPMPTPLQSGEPGGHQTLAPLVTDDNAMRDAPPSLGRALAARAQNQSSYAPNVQGPDGKLYQIPPDQLEAALAAGGTRIDSGRA